MNAIFPQTLQRLENDSWAQLDPACDENADTLFASVCTFLVSFVQNFAEHKNLIADTPHCLEHFSEALLAIEHTATCCDVLSALLHHNMRLCTSAWAPVIIGKAVHCLVGPLRQWATECTNKSESVVAPSKDWEAKGDRGNSACWTATTKVLSLLIELALCDSVALEKNHLSIITLLLRTTVSSTDSLKWCADIQWLESHKRPAEAHAAFVQFLRLVSICCAFANKDRMRNMCARLMARLFSLHKLMRACTAQTLRHGSQFVICEGIRHLVLACEADHQVCSSCMAIAWVC